MSAAAIVAIVVVVVVLVIVGVALRALSARRRRRQMQGRFGPEYDRVVDATGDERQAHAVLQSRVEEHDRIDIRPLDPIQRDRYAQEWRSIQAEFVDAPTRSLAAADGLVSQVMRDRGYPVDDFDRRADLVSVDHPEVVRHYRSAHEVFARSQGGAEPSTEAVRQALVDYRSLFAELLRPEGSQVPTEPRPR